MEVTLHGVTRMMARLEGDACLRADGATWLCASLAPVLYADPFGRAGMTTGGAALSFGVAHF